MVSVRYSLLPALHFLLYLIVAKNTIINQINKDLTRFWVPFDPFWSPTLSHVTRADFGLV